MAILHTPAFGNGVCVGGWGRNSIDFFFSPFENSQNFQENEWWLLSSYHAKWHLCSSVPPGLKHVLTNPGNPPLNVVLNWMEELCIVQQVIDLFAELPTLAVPWSHLGGGADSSKSLSTPDPSSLQCKVWDDTQTLEFIEKPTRKNKKPSK